MLHWGATAETRPRYRWITIDRVSSPLVLTGLQNDFLGPNGVALGGSGNRVRKNNNAAIIEALRQAVKRSGIEEVHAGDSSLRH